MEIIVSIKVSPGSRQGEDIAHLPVLKEKLAKIESADDIAVIAIDSASMSEICEGLYSVFTGKEGTVKQIVTKHPLSSEGIFELLKVRIAIQEAYINGAKYIFVISNLNHVSPVPEIRIAEYLGAYHTLGFQPLYLYC